MSKSALGILVSFVILAVAAPAATASTAHKTRKKPVKAAQQKVHHRQHGRHHLASHAAVPVARASLVQKAGMHRASYAPAPAAAPVYTAGDLAGLNATRDPLALRSNAAIVVDAQTSQVLYEKNASVPLPIASLTKLMTALIVLEGKQNMDEVLEVSDADVDREKFSSSRLRVGSTMSRTDMLHIALMSSENRAASALGRHYPGGLPAFVAAMNAKAKALGMNDTHYVDSTGLSSQNTASARDLAKLVAVAHQHALIREYSTDDKYAVSAGRYTINYMNSNRLVMNSNWDIDLQKTGYITEAGRCLLMHTRIDNRPVVMVFLDSKGKDSRLADAGRVRKWLETSRPQNLVQATARQG
ncbi:D-alanyl-D-alanine endopeptidase [Noviherbaspirillum galbum]|uniref:D-alanyl-D-alanine endopeptidase n=1 Tax=Noviherbaspirillum galbum TaxID=2709383 RepID=A0A6B3SK59_9BURK|nr:D-alanyl-D-alanine endopeptidase [Noviherbaspirillum galbum]NEX61137.1 D-alanyl-D-alanine endopeptidase [Noviherbaspirillum galbum]